MTTDDELDAKLARVAERIQSQGGMRWRRSSDYSHESHCGRYSVAAYGTPGGWTEYAAWRTPTHPDGRNMLSMHKTLSLAFAACAEDAAPKDPQP